MSKRLGRNAPGLIQDITYQTTASGDREGRINHAAAIGELDDAWQRQAKTAYHGLGIMPYAEQGSQNTPKQNVNYNSLAQRVPPLSLLATDFADTPHFPAFERLHQSAIAMWAAVTAFLGRHWTTIHGRTSHYLPKKYTLVQGAYTDWGTTFIAVGKRFAIPLAAIVLLVIAAVSFPIDNPPASKPGTNGHNPSVTIQQSATNNSNSASGTNKNNGGSTSTSAGSSSGKTNTGTSNLQSGGTSTTQSGTPSLQYPSYSSSSTPSYSGGTIGGYGGGSSTPTSPTTSSPTTSPTTKGIPGVTSPYPVTVPGQSVDLNGKPVGSTSPTTITLN